MAMAGLYACNVTTPTGGTHTGNGRAAASDDEFAERASPNIALGSVLRVNRHPQGTDVGQWRATAAGIVVAPGVVVTLRSLTDGMSGDEDLQIIGQNHLAYPATIINRGSDSELILLTAPGLPAPPTELSDTPVGDGDAVTAAGYAMTVQNETQGDQEVRRWTVAPSLLTGRVSVGDDGITHDMTTGYGYGGGALLDRCGRVSGVLIETLDEQGQSLQTAVAVDRLRSLLRAANVNPQVRAGWCAPADTIARVRAARRQIAAADGAANVNFDRERANLENQRRLALTTMIGLGGAAGALGAIGAAVSAMRKLDPARPRRKPGMTLLFSGVAILGVGVAIDPVIAMLQPPAQMVRLQCSFDQANSSEGARVDRPVTLSFDPNEGCRGGTPQSGDLHYAIGVAEPTSTTPVFIRTIRPASASRQMGPGRPSIIETHVFATDLSRYDIRRYQLPAVLYPAVQRVFSANNTQQTCRTPQVSDASQSARRRLVIPYAAEPRGVLVSHTAFRCERVEADRATP